MISKNTNTISGPYKTSMILKIPGLLTITLLGTIRNYDGEGNGNVKKALI